MLTGHSKKINKTNIEDILSLTPTQEGMLFHYLSHKDKGYYFQQLSLQLSGTICVQSLRKAWNYVIESNEMLRTVYRWEKLEHPVQIILKSLDVPIQEHDFSAYSAEEGHKLAQEAREKDRQTELDIEVQPLRISISWLKENSCEIVITWHHILYDGWSNGILVKEFLNAYQAFYAGGEPQSVRKTRFKEFIKWQKTQDKLMQKRFWEDSLQGLEGITALPYDNENKSESSVVHSIISTFTDLETQAIFEFVKANEITLASLLFSVWGILLQKYNHMNDVLFGTTVSGRVPQLEGMEEMVGLFINTIPLRVTSQHDELAIHLIKNVDEALKEREDYENTSLVDIRNYSGIQGNGNMFSSIVVLENYPLDSRIQNNSLLRIDSYSMYETTNYDLTLGIKTFDDLELDLAYDSSRFSGAAVERMANHFKEIAMQTIHKPEIKVSDIEIVTLEEKNRILFEFNRPVQESIDREAVVQQVFEMQAEQTPNRIAVTYEGKGYTYKEINEKANLLARALRQHGIKPDCPAALIIERSAAFFIAMLGVLKAGGTYIPIDHEYARGRIAHILNDSAAGLLITQRGLANDLGFAGTVIYIDDESLYTGDRTNLDIINEPHNMAYIIYTSGSTGNPKGVMVEHRNLLAYVSAFQSEFFLTPDDVILQQASCSFDHFVEEAYPALLHGGSIVIVKKLDVMDIDKLMKLVDEYGISMITCQPLLLNELNKRVGIPKVHTFLSGGDVLKPEHISNLITRAKVYNTYGPTEATVCATYYRCSFEDVRSMPIGSPILNYRVYILNAEHKLMPVGITGEICIAGDGVARGYLNQLELTKEKFVQDPFQSGGRMYKSGDVGKWLSDGSIQFMGRNDEQIKIRGFRIEPGEIEHHLLLHEAVDEAIVMPVDDANGVKCLAAYVKPKYEVKARELKDYLAQSVPHYMIPTYFYKIDRIPWTANDKLDKKALGGCVDALDFGAEDEEAASETEEKIRSTWKEILKREKIGLHDHFFDIGGNSILLMHMHAKLEKEYAWGTNIVDLFSHSTIAKLAQWIENKQQTWDESNFVSYQKLPLDYFGNHMQASGSGVIQLHLHHKLLESIRQIAIESNVQLFDVLLSMYAYLFTEVSENKAATLQCLKENGEEAVPLSIDLTALKNFQELFGAVSSKRKHPENNRPYPIHYKDSLNLKKGNNSILPLVCKDIELSIDARFLEIFDIVLCMEENSQDNELLLTCKFNDKRINKEKMHTFLAAYIDLLQQLAKSHAFS